MNSTTGVSRCVSVCVSEMRSYEEMEGGLDGASGAECGPHCATVTYMTLIGVSIGALFVLIRESLGLKI